MSEAYPGQPIENPFKNPEIKKDDDDDDRPESLGRRTPEKKSKKNDDKEQGPSEKPELKHLKESGPSEEKEAPLDGLGETEKQDIVQELAAARRSELEAELAEATPESVQAVEAAAALQEMERIETTGEIEAGIETGEETGENSLEDAPVALEAVEGEIPLGSSAEDEEDSTTTAATTFTSGPSTIGAGGGGTIPPVPPGAGSSSHRPFGVMGRGSRGRPASPDSYSSADLAYYERHAQNRGLLVGLIVGYLIGRRGGRIRTEKRLLPVQRKLEKEVKDIQEQLDARETKIRTLAYERLPEKQKMAERFIPLSRRIIGTDQERMASRLGLEKPARIERLGKAIINNAEAPLAVKPELRSITPEHVKSMNHNELLLLSEKVVVEGASLRQIYEQHLIGERGLRRLIVEYLQGKDIRKDLREEMIEREIDFERDPMLRDAALHTVAGRDSSTSGTTALQQLLEKAGATATPDDALLPVARLQAEAQAEARQREHQRRQIFDTAIVTLIVVLAVAVIVLLARR